MRISGLLLKKITAVCLAVGAVVMFIFICSREGENLVSNNLFSSLFTIAILFFTILSAVRFFYRADKRADLLLRICLAIQSIYFVISGLIFENHFGPFFGIAIYVERTVILSIDLELLAFIAKNGFNSAVENLLVGINLIPIGIMLLIWYFERKEKKLKPGEEFSVRG